MLQIFNAYTHIVIDILKIDVFINHKENALKYYYVFMVYLAFVCYSCNPNLWLFYPTIFSIRYMIALELLLILKKTLLYVLLSHTSVSYPLIIHFTCKQNYKTAIG